jgi:hypothetical protein
MASPISDERGSRQRTRTLAVVATRERTRGRAVLELASPEDPTQRFTLWPGLPPPEGPLHPSLAPRILSGRVQGEPVWLEARPTGAPLNRVAAQLGTALLALVMRDCCEGLAALHEAGRVHGDVKSKRVVLDEGGYATLVGVGQRQAHPEEDLAALIRLGRTVSGEISGLCLPEVVPADADALLAILEEPLGGQDETQLRDALASLSSAELSPIPEEPTMLQVVVEHTQGARGRMDELNPVLGPEAERTGSHISWSSSTGEVTRESTVEATHAVSEGTGALPALGDALSRRTQVFSRLLAPMGPSAPAARLEERRGRPCQAIRALVMDSPLDPLTLEPALSGGLAPLIARGVAARDISVTQVFRGRDTQVDQPVLAPRMSKGRMVLVVFLLLAFTVGMIVGSTLLYFFGTH